jgi:hypothetical protein
MMELESCSDLDHSVTPSVSPTHPPGWLVGRQGQGGGGHALGGLERVSSSVQVLQWVISLLLSLLVLLVQKYIY